MVGQVEFGKNPRGPHRYLKLPIEPFASLDFTTIDSEQYHLPVVEPEEQFKRPTEFQNQAIPTSPENSPRPLLKIQFENSQINASNTSGTTLNNIRRSGSVVTARVPPLAENHILHSYSPQPLSKMNPARLFIASLGNPPPYSSTRHSAGHIAIKALQSYLQLPPFQKSKTYANGFTSIGADVGRTEYTLWQSPSLMNISGVGLLKAYKAFAASAQGSPTDPLPGLVILYDEMETAPSQLRLRRGATSAKGHNGLKSVQQSLQSAGLMGKLGDRFVKIGVGIGRPAGGSRTTDDVSRYVLGQLTTGEKDAIDSKVNELMSLLDAELLRNSK